MTTFNYNPGKIACLYELGATIWGKHWKSELAEHLRINDRSVRQWANGERSVPDSVLRVMLSIAHEKANMIACCAESAARELMHITDYQRIIYKHDLRLAEIRPDLYTDRRDCFDIDGRLYALNENGSVIDIHGRETEWNGQPVLPADITVDDLKATKLNYITDGDNPD